MELSELKMLVGAAALGLSLMACRPVLTVGWGEVLLVSAVILLVFAPLAIRLFRNFRKIINHQDQDDN